jgi:UMF1 family MFS transporter
MGGIQALSRSFFGKLVPPEQSAEFFGFYNISGKFATISGPFLVGVTGQLTGQSRFGVLSILILFVIGSLILSQVDESAGSPEQA